MAKTESKQANGSKYRFTKVTRTRARFWKPDDDSSSIVVKLIELVEAQPGARVQRPKWLVENLEPAEDVKGPIAVEERLSVGLGVVLADLMRGLKPGAIVKISPAGLDGRVKLYDLEVADA